MFRYEVLCDGIRHANKEFLYSPKTIPKGFNITGFRHATLVTSLPLRALSMQHGKVSSFLSFFPFDFSDAPFYIYNFSFVYILRTKHHDQRETTSLFLFTLFHSRIPAFPASHTQILWIIKSGKRSFYFVSFCFFLGI